MVYTDRKREGEQKGAPEGRQLFIAREQLHRHLPRTTTNIRRPPSDTDKATQRIGALSGETPKGPTQSGARLILRCVAKSHRRLGSAGSIGHDGTTGGGRETAEWICNPLAGSSGLFDVLRRLMHFVSPLSLVGRKRRAFFLARRAIRPHWITSLH